MIGLSRLVLVAIYLQWCLVQGTEASRKRTSKHRMLQDSCINGFSVYNATSKNTKELKSSAGITAPTRILLDEYPQRRINILVNLQSSCSQTTKCVRITLGDFQSTDQTTPPYALFGDEDGIPLAVRPAITYDQDLTAWTFPTSDCSGNYTNTQKVVVQLVPRTSKGYELRYLNVSYNGVTAKSATQADVDALVNATCEFVYRTFDEELLSKDTIGVSKFLCWQPAKTKSSSGTYTPPYTITYRFITRVTMSSETSIYSNRYLPLTKVLNDYIRHRFVDATSFIGLGSFVYMSDYVKDKLQSTNPFDTYTNVTTVG